MLKHITLCAAGILGLTSLISSTAFAQTESLEDAAVEQIRSRDDIKSGDQRQIEDWVELQATNLVAAIANDPNAGLKKFRSDLNAQYSNDRNTSQFRMHLASRTTAVAARWFAKADTNPVVWRAFATVLVDFRRLETFDGLLAGVKTADAACRFLCVRGLTELKTELATDRAQLAQAIQALRDTGLAESSPVVLGRIYLALAYPGEAAAFDAYMALFDKRLADRRAGGVVVDRAEVNALEFFRDPATIGPLTQPQKTQLVNKLAVFLRLDAERYNKAELDEYEAIAIERRLDGTEEVLSALLGGRGGGDIRGELEKGGHELRGQVVEQAYLWVGNPQTKDAGALNTAPWDVPVGAP